MVRAELRPKGPYSLRLSGRHASDATRVVSAGTYRATIRIEDSSRVDPWIVRQAERERAACRERLAAFSRLDRTSGEG